MKPKGYADLADLPEDERIQIIGFHTMKGNIVAIAIDDDDEKVARYIEKITTRFPKLRHIDTLPGLVPDTVMVRIGPKADQ